MQQEEPPHPSSIFLFLLKSLEGGSRRQEQGEAFLGSGKQMDGHERDWPPAQVEPLVAAMHVQGLSGLQLHGSWNCLFRP